MNTGAVAQPPIANAEVADRWRNASRKSGSGDGDFAGLLNKLANNREPDDRRAASEPDASVGDADNSQLLSWLRGAAEAAREGGEADLEPALARQDGGAEIDINALLQMLSGGGVPTSANGFAAMIARLANGTATEADAAMMQAALAAREHGETLSPEQAILANLAKAAGQTGKLDSDDAKAIIVTLAVLNRETHLAPTAEAGMDWAAHLAMEGGRVLRTSTQTGGASGNVQVPQSTSAMEQGEAQLINPQSAVTAVRDGQLGTESRRGGSGSAEQQSALDALSGGGEQAAAVGRSDALINTGLVAPLTQQIADRVAAEADTLITQTARSDTPVFAVKHESAVKVLHIQLQPADLGTVTIRMSVKDNALRLDLEVGRGETAHLIQKDREALSALLRSAGYVIDGMDVRVADQSGAQTGNAPSNMMQGGGQSGSSQAESRSSGERPQDGRQQQSFGNGRHGEDEQAGQTPARRGGVYI